MVVIVWLIDAAGNRQIERPVIQKRCRGQYPTVKGGPVKKRLQRRSGLASGDNTVHEPRSGRIGRKACINKNLPCGVFDNENSAFSHMARFQLRQMMGQPLFAIPL